MLTMRHDVPRFAQRIPHQRLIVAPHKRPIVFGTEQNIAPAAQQRRALVDATCSLNGRDVFQHLNAFWVAQHRQCCVWKKLGDGANRRRGEQGIADAGDIDDQYAFGIGCLLCSNWPDW